MKIDMKSLYWSNQQGMEPRQFICAFCTVTVGSNTGYNLQQQQARTIMGIYICPNCHAPTFLYSNQQFPAPVFGNVVQHVPPEINNLYNEARASYSVGANTGAAMLCRKLVMNVAVHLGAAQDQSFKTYVDYLESNRYSPAGAKPWIDYIRTKGNEATHDIPETSPDDARHLIEFCEWLLKMVFEFPKKITT